MRESALRATDFTVLKQKAVAHEHVARYGRLLMFTVRGEAALWDGLSWVAGEGWGRDLMLLPLDLLLGGRAVQVTRFRAILDPRRIFAELQPRLVLRPAVSAIPARKACRRRLAA